MNVGNIIYLNCGEIYEVRPDVVRTGALYNVVTQCSDMDCFHGSLIDIPKLEECLRKRTHFPNGREFFSGRSSTLAAETSSSENTQY